MATQAVDYRINSRVDDAELEHLHAEAFGERAGQTPWCERLERHSLFWVTARIGGQLVGFVNVIGDGGAHAILLDTCVAPDHQGTGIGVALVAHAATEARRRGCDWLHADYEPHLVPFYEGRCGLRPTPAGLMRLR